MYFPRHEYFHQISDLPFDSVLKNMHICAFCVRVCLCRWVHAVCESLYTEDEVEQASDEGFACTSCTPYVPRPVGES